MHDSENLGSAIIATAIQGHNRHAKQVPGMPALDPGTDLGTPSPLRRINPQPARPGIATTCAAFSHDHHFFSDNDLAPKILCCRGAPGVVVDAVEGRDQMRQYQGLDPRLLCDTADILDRRVVGLHVRH